jgi:hypothetical protein
LNFLFRRFLRFLPESVSQDHEVFPVEEGEYPEDVGTHFNPDFVKALGAGHVIEVLCRNPFEGLQQIQGPFNFSLYFIRLCFIEVEKITFVRDDLPNHSENAFFAKLTIQTTTVSKPAKKTAVEKHSGFPINLPLLACGK